ncbi:MAG: hypothetical protein EOO36_24685 [Cytophagaceae bacterium]|nr:MAG: hypothetical protein EOO36_24685 [Cytophagaceae bacterium]
MAQAFEAFFEQIAAHYPGYQRYTFNCVGSVNHHLQGVLAATATRHGMAVGQFLQTPIEALVHYHARAASPE